MNPHTLLTLLRTPHLRSAISRFRDLQPFLRIHFLFAALELGLLDALHTPYHFTVAERKMLFEKLVEWLRAGAALTLVTPV